MEGVKTKHFRQTEVWRGTSPPLVAFLSLLWFLSRIQPCRKIPESFGAATHPNEKQKKSWLMTISQATRTALLHPYTRALLVEGKEFKPTPHVRDELHS